MTSKALGHEKLFLDYGGRQPGDATHSFVCPGNFICQSSTYKIFTADYLHRLMVSVVGGYFWTGELGVPALSGALKLSFDALGSHSL